jgi:hypothetical protein
MIIILDLLEELTVKYLIGAIPEGFSSTFCIVNCGRSGKFNFAASLKEVCMRKGNRPENHS